MDDDLYLGQRIASHGGQLALDYQGGALDPSQKDDGSIVTAADLAVEQLLRDSLASARPDDAVLGEEGGLVGSGSRVWIIDPIDGTSFYARGEPDWRVHVALQVDGEVTIAVVVAPALGVQWWATRGGGAYEATWPRDDAAPRRLSVSTISELTEATADAFPADHRDRLAPALLAPPSPLSLVGLVRGEIEAVVAECCMIWDHAPWLLLTEEAGGRFTDTEGGRSGEKGGGLYSNAAIHDRFLRHLGYPVASS